MRLIFAAESIKDGRDQYAVDIIGIYCLVGDSLPDGEPERQEGGEEMTILFAVAGSPLACFAEGAILAASVYLVSRGVKNPLRNSKK